MSFLPATVALEVIECPKCALVFAVSRAFFEQRVADRGFCSCPATCSFQLGVGTAADRLRTAMLAALQRAEADVVAQKMTTLALRREVHALRRAAIDQLVGPNTTEEGR